MLETRQGDILKADDIEAIVNPVNCVGVMGGGLALQFKKFYPEINFPYEIACRDGVLTVDCPQILGVSRAELPMYVVNLATKIHWRNPSQLEWIDQGLDSMYRQLAELDVKSVGIPALGAGLGGLSWPSVKEVIDRHADRHPEIRTTVFLPVLKEQL